MPRHPIELKYEHHNIGDGYISSVAFIYDLHPSIRLKMRRRNNGKAGASNVFE
jgi:hypothetical protein